MAEGTIQCNQKPLLARQHAVLPLDLHIAPVNVVVAWSFSFQSAQLADLWMVFQKIRDMLIEQVLRVCDVESLTELLLRN